MDSAIDFVEKGCAQPSVQEITVEINVLVTIEMRMLIKHLGDHC